MTDQREDYASAIRKSYSPESAHEGHLKVKLVDGIAPANYGSIQLFYDINNNVTGVLYYSGVSFDGTLLKSLTLTYDGTNVTGVSVA